LYVYVKRTPLEKVGVPATVHPLEKKISITSALKLGSILITLLG